MARLVCTKITFKYSFSHDLKFLLNSFYNLRTVLERTLETVRNSETGAFTTLDLFFKMIYFISMMFSLMSKKLLIFLTVYFANILVYSL